MAPAMDNHNMFIARIVNIMLCASAISIISADIVREFAYIPYIAHAIACLVLAVIIARYAERAHHLATMDESRGLLGLQ